MADVWVKYRNKKSGAEGVCKYTDFKSAIKRTDKLTIVQKYDGRPGGGGKVIESKKEKPKKEKSKKAPIKEPDAAKEAITNKVKADKDKSNSEK